jgi:hypothetical protein
MRLLILCACLAGTTAFVARPAIVQRHSSVVVVDPSRTNTLAPLSSTPTADTEYELLSRPARPGRPLKVAIAGGGVGGLTTALCLLKKGFDVTVYEKTAAFARFGGPIQFASNALSVLKEIDEELFRRVMEKFTFTGTRRCGIKDGLRADGNFRMTNDSLDYLWNPDAPADWFVKFPLKVCTVLSYLKLRFGSAMAITRCNMQHGLGVAPSCVIQRKSTLTIFFALRLFFFFVVTFSILL